MKQKEQKLLKQIWLNVTVVAFVGISLVIIRMASIGSQIVVVLVNRVKSDKSFNSPIVRRHNYP